MEKEYIKMYFEVLEKTGYSFSSPIFEIFINELTILSTISGKEYINQLLLDSKKGGILYSDNLASVHLFNDWYADDIEFELEMISDKFWMPIQVLGIKVSTDDYRVVFQTPSINILSVN